MNSVRPRGISLRVIPAGIAGVLLASPVAALPASQPGYDLKCEGNMSGLDGANAQAHASPFTMTLHVDLNHKSFCQDGCDTRETISKVLPSNIIFRAVNAPLPNRLWVADTGQFSYTWAEASARDEKPSMRSAQGFCTKVVTGSSGDKDGVKQKVSVPAPKFPIGQKPTDQPRSGKLSGMEFRALLNIQNHRPVPASMHTRLYDRGFVRLDNDLWVLTARGEAIITGDRR